MFFIPKLVRLHPFMRKDYYHIRNEIAGRSGFQEAIGPQWLGTLRFTRLFWLPFHPWRVA